MSYPDMHRDCGECAALCCLAFSIDQSDMFAIDKPAGVPCPNLDARHGCTIHTDLEARGFAGCVRYDCLGAGQRVTQEVFDGRSWRDAPGLIGPMMEAFRGMRRVHDSLAMLQVAERYDLAPELEAERQQLVEALSPNVGWSSETLLAFETGDAVGRVDSFIKGLRDQVGT